jgi:hypothetical protein
MREERVMSRRNSLPEKAKRRAEREQRKGSFVPTQISFPRMNKATKIEFDEEGNQTESEIEVESGEFHHIVSRKELRRRRKA